METRIGRRSERLAIPDVLHSFPRHPIPSPSSCRRIDERTMARSPGTSDNPTVSERPLDEDSALLPASQKEPVKATPLPLPQLLILAMVRLAEPISNTQVSVFSSPQMFCRTEAQWTLFASRRYSLMSMRCRCSFPHAQEDNQAHCLPHLDDGTTARY